MSRAEIDESKSEPLTDAQRELVERNIRLVYGAMRNAKWFVSRFGFDEAYPLGCYVLCRCARVWKPDGGAALSSFFYVSFCRACYAAQERSYRCDSPETMTQIDGWEPFDHRVTPDRDAPDDCRILIESLAITHPQCARVLAMVAGGMNQREIAFELGVTRTRAYALLHQGIGVVRERHRCKGGVPC